MSLTVEVSLISGKTVSLETHGDELVVRAQRALRAGKGRLSDSTGSILDGGMPLKKARLQYAEPLTLQVRRIDICGGRTAFGGWLGRDWGNSLFLGDGSGVQDQLKNVQQIQASGRAFAAILGDGSVVTRGGADFGGDSSGVRDQLTNLQQI